MNSKENIFLKKMDNESITEFENCIPIINANKNIKEIFYFFLYSDIIDIEIDNINLIDIDSVLYEPENTINTYLENIKDKIINKNNNLLGEFKKELKKKIVIIKTKISECEAHIKILKDEYVNISLENYVSINNTKKLFLFENKSVLFIQKKKNYNLILSDFFARYLFCSIEKNNDNSVNISDLYNNFYENSKINSYIDITTGDINKFVDIHNNFKYWVILLLLIGQIFSDTSKYYLIFNSNEFNKHINLILNPIKEKKDKKDKKSKILRILSRGGRMNEFMKIIEDSKKKNKKNTIQTITQNPNPIEFYKKILTNTFINSNSLSKIYYESFNKNIKEYFIKKIIFNPPTVKINVENIKFVHPFNNKINIKLTDVTKITKKTIQETNKNNLFDNIIFNLFQSLYLLLNDDNLDYLNKFIKNLKKKLIILLYYLYNIKLNIYKSYINKIYSLFNNTINEEVKKENEKKEEVKKEEVKKEEVKKENEKKENEKKEEVKNTNLSINNKIKKKKNEIIMSKNDNGIINYDKKKILLEKELKDLILLKYITLNKKIKK